MEKDGIWKLSPAFDVCHSFKPGSPWVSQQSLSVNGKRRNINRADFLSVARQMNIKKAADIIDQINAIIQNWKKYAEKTGVSNDKSNAIQKTLVKTSINYISK